MMSGPDFKFKQVVFAFFSKGEKLSFRNDNVVIKDKDDQVIYQVSCYRVFALFIIGHTTITSGLIERANKFKFPIVLMNQSFKRYGFLSSATNGNTALKRKQYQVDDLVIGRSIIQNKVANQLQLLKEIRNKDDALKEEIIMMKSYLKELNNVNDLKSILGLEGSASRIYFRNVFDTLNWSARRPRVKHDSVNCLLDIGYTLLFNLIEAMLDIYGFDTYVGVLHREYYMRKSLVCDLIEPFRPIVDGKLRKMYHLGQVDEKDFHIRKGAYNLSWQRSPKYVNLLMEEILSYKMELFLYIQGYYRAFMKDKPIADYPQFMLG